MCYGVLSYSERSIVIASLSRLVTLAYSNKNLRTLTSISCPLGSKIRNAHLYIYAVASSDLQNAFAQRVPSAAIFAAISSWLPAPVGSPRKNTNTSCRSEKSRLMGT